MADPDFFFNDATLEAFRDMANPKAARAKLIARAEAESAQRQQVATNLANSALAAAGYAPPQQPKPEPKSAEVLKQQIMSMTPGQRRTLETALFGAEAELGDDSSAESLTAGFDPSGAYLAEDDTYSEADYFGNAETDDDDGEY